MTCTHRSLIDQFLYGGVCKECKQEKIERRREKGRRDYRNHKEKVLAKHAEYRRNNPEKIKEIRERYKLKMSTRNV